MKISLFKQTKKLLLKKLKFKPQLSIITGSGISIFKKYKPVLEVKYSNLPLWSKENKNRDSNLKNVQGHEGKLKIFYINKKCVLVFSGRKHLYQGANILEVVANTRLAYELGSEKLLITNAAGGINKKFKPGNLMLIKGFIDLMQQTERGTLSGIIHPPKILRTKLNDLILKKIKTKLKSGIYAGVQGPSYETYSEIKLLQLLKADAVGMSTIPELICAKSLGLDSCGISVISNVWDLKHKPSHEEVLKNVQKANEELEALIFKIIKHL